MRAVVEARGDHRAKLITLDHVKKREDREYLQIEQEEELVLQLKEEQVEVQEEEQVGKIKEEQVGQIKQEPVEDLDWENMEPMKLDEGTQHQAMLDLIAVFGSQNNSQ